MIYLNKDNVGGKCSVHRMKEKFAVCWTEEQSSQRTGMRTLGVNGNVTCTLGVKWVQLAQD